MNKLFMIQDFIGWAFYGNVVGKRIREVGLCYDIYCSNFGIKKPLDYKEAQALICQEFNCMLANGVYTKIRGDI